MKIFEWLKLKVKVDFFRLLTLKIVFIFLCLTIARILGLEVDDHIYNSWTNVTMAMLPSSGIKESAGYFQRKGGVEHGNETGNTEAKPRL